MTGAGIGAESKGVFRHMSVSRSIILLGACALLPAAFSADIPGPGVFYESSSGLLRMLEAPSPTLSSQSIWAFVLDPVNPAPVYYAYSGGDAPVAAGRRPVFYINLGLRPDRDLRKLQILHLTRKGRHRQAKYSWNSESMQGGFHGSAPLSVLVSPEGVVTVAPAADLEPGQYLLSLGPLLAKYDFTVN
jgi:hypothetical protein